MCHSSSKKGVHEWPKGRGGFVGEKKGTIKKRDGALLTVKSTIANPEASQSRESPAELISTYRAV